MSWSSDVANRSAYAASPSTPGIMPVGVHGDPSCPAPGGSTYAAEFVHAPASG
ncbi:hypothetical protein ACGFIF_37165 [Kribbella sp. NPDC049174]|uniref:hypothetical protein n=1 Tax=Kribbella sp. NPDC049174 TaxID=3364112 RepID=UPI003723FE80